MELIVMLHDLRYFWYFPTFSVFLLTSTVFSISFHTMYLCLENNWNIWILLIIPMFVIMSLKDRSRSIITTSLTSSSAASLTCLLLLPPHFHYLWPIPSSLPFSPVVTWHWYFLYWWVDVLINVLTPFSKSVNNHLPKRENIFCINFIIKNKHTQKPCSCILSSYSSYLGGVRPGGGERTIPPWEVGQERRAK